LPIADLSFGLGSSVGNRKSKIGNDLG
jgi:hypothetical protein